MCRFWKLLPVAGLCAGLGLTMSVADAQPPERKGPPPRGERRGPEGERRPDSRSESQVDAWVRTLAEKMTDPHDTIRESARAGLIAAGPAALPILRRVAEGDDEARATAARRLIDAIERGGPRGMMPGGPRGFQPPFFGGFGGFGGRGPDARPPFGRGPERPRDGERPRDEERPRGDRPDQPDRRRADEPGGPRFSGDPLVRALREIGLNEEQRKRVAEVRETFENRMREVLEQARDGQFDRQEAREKVQKMAAEMVERLQDMLTPDQGERFREAMRRFGPPMGRPGGGPPDEPRPDRP